MSRTIVDMGANLRREPDPDLKLIQPGEGWRAYQEALRQLEAEYQEEWRRWFGNLVANPEKPEGA